MTTRLALAFALFAAACGSAHHTVDANRDTSTDTLAQPSGDAPPGAVTLTVTSSNLPAANVPVYFQNADSSLVLAATTDAHGTVGAMLGTGGFVTAIEPADLSGLVKLDTFAGVHAGDALHLDLTATPSQSGTDTVLTVATDPGASAYNVYSQCGVGNIGPGAMGEVNFPGCGDTADLLVVSLDADSSPSMAYFQSNVTIGPAPTDAVGYPADISSGTYVGLAPTNFMYTSVPSTILYVRTDQQLWSPRGRMFDQATTSMPSAGVAMHTLMQPAPAGLTAVTVTDATPDPSTNANQHGEQLVFDWGAWATDYTLPLGSVLLRPYLNDATYAVDTHTINWMEGTGVLPDFARARVLAYRDAIPAGRTWQWSIIAPRTMSASIAFPTLPVNDYDYNPATGDSVSVADLTNVKAPGGYDSFRAQGFTDVKSLAGVGSTTTTKLVVQLPFTAPL